MSRTHYYICYWYQGSVYFYCSNNRFCKFEQHYIKVGFATKERAEEVAQKAKDYEHI